MVKYYKNYTPSSTVYLISRASTNLPLPYSKRKSKRTNSQMSRKIPPFPSHFLSSLVNRHPDSASLTLEERAYFVFWTVHFHN